MDESQSHSAPNCSKTCCREFSRPVRCFCPIVFSLGAKVENVPLRDFLANPTKITNALRQIRARISLRRRSLLFRSLSRSRSPRRHSAVARQTTNQQRCTGRTSATKRRTPRRPPLPEEAAKHPRVGVAVEVIQRLKSLLRDEPLLLAGVSGPFTLAAQLLQLTQTEAPRSRRSARRRRRTRRRNNHANRHQIGRSRRQRNLHPRRNSSTARAAERRSWATSLSPSVQYHSLLPSPPSPANHRHPFLRRKQSRNLQSKLGLHPVPHTPNVQEWRCIAVRTTTHRLSANGDRSAIQRVSIGRIQYRKLPPIAS